MYVEKMHIVQEASQTWRLIKSVLHMRKIYIMEYANRHANAMEWLTQHAVILSMTL